MAEKGLLSGIFRKEGRKGMSKDTWMVFLTLVLIFALALFLRSYFGWNEATRYGAPFLVSGGSDSYYHERAIYTAAYEHHSLLNDPMLNYPVGARNPRPPDYDWSIVIGGYLLNPIVGDLNAALSYSLIISTALWGALTVFPTYMIGKKAFNKRVGLISAFLLATLPAHMQRSPLTNADHDAFVLFFGVSSIYFLLVALENIKEKEWVESWRDFSGVRTGLKEMFRENRKAFLYAGLSASSLLTIALTWKGFSYMYIILMLYFVIQLFVNRFRNIDPTTITFISAMVLFLPIVLAFPYYFRAHLYSWLIAPSAMASVAVVLGVYFSGTKKLPWTLTIPVLFLILAILGAFVSIFFPSIIEIVGRQTGYFTRTKTYQTIAEAQAPYFSNMVLSFGPATFFMALLAVMWIIWKMRKNWNPYFILFVIWSAVSIYMALSAARFMFNAAPAFALASGWLLYYIIRRSDFGYIRKTYRTLSGNRLYAIRKSVKVKHVLVSLFVVFLVIMPNVWYSVDAGIPSNEKKEYDREIYEAMPAFLRPSPDVFNESSRGTWYLGAFGYSLPTPDQYWPAAWRWLSQQDSDRLPEDRPGFLSWWDYGFECIQQGKHPTVADNFLYGHQLAGNFIMAQNETDAVSLLAERILDSQFDKDKNRFTKKAMDLMVRYFGEEDAEKIEDIYAHPQRYVPEILSHPKKYGPYDSQISDYNARYIATRGVLMKYDREHLVSFLKSLEDMTGKRIAYFAIDSRLIPFSAQNTGIFYAPAVLSDHRMSKGAYRLPYDFYEIYAVTKYGKKYPINEVPEDVRKDIDHSEIEYKDMFYNTMLYRNYFGYSPKEAGSTANGLPGISDNLKNMQPMPGWNLTHFRLVYRTVYWNPYKDYRNHSDAWRAIGLDEGLEYQKEGKGVVDLSPNTMYNGVTFLEYYEGAIINGTVRTPEGSPVGNIRVTVYDKYGIPHQSVKTDSNGRYSLIAPFGNITIVASNGGSLDKVKLMEKNVLNRTTMYIRKDQAMRERVDLDGDGRWDYLIEQELVASTSSIKGTVFLDTNNDGSKQDTESGYKATVILYGKSVEVNYTGYANDSGFYEIKDVVPGDYGIKVSIGTYEKDLNITVTVDPKKEKQQDIAIPTGEVRGRITTEDGERFANQALMLKNTEDERYVEFYTDENGEYFINGVIPGTYRFVPENSSYAPSSYVAGVFENKTTYANITVYRAHKIEGYVNINGKGVPNLYINFVNYTFPSMSVSTVTDEYGHYSVILPEGNYVVTSTYIKNTTRYILGQKVSVTRNESSISFEMIRPYKVTGYIKYKSYYKDMFPVTFVREDGTKLVVYSVKGNYTAYLPGGKYHVYVSHIDLGFPYAFSGYLEVKGDSNMDIDLVRGDIVIGNLYGVANTTVRGALISFISPTGERFSTLSDDKGHYSFVLKPGNYLMRISSELYKTYEKNLNLTPEEAPQDVNPHLSPKEVLISGTVKEDGAPVPGVNITFSGYNSTFTTVSDDEGGYSINLPAGRYTVLVEQNISADGSERYETTHADTVVLYPGKPVRHDISIERRYRISGMVALHGGPVNVTIWVSSNGTSFPYTVTNGSFEFYLPEGNYALNATYDKNRYGFLEGISVKGAMNLSLNMTDVYSVSISMLYGSEGKEGIPLTISFPGGKKTFIHEGEIVNTYLPRGTYGLEVNYTVRESVEGITRNVTYTADETLRVNGNVTHILHLSREVPEGKLTGTLYLGDIPLGNHELSFVSSDTGYYYNVTTDSGGHFELDAPMGTFVLYSTAYSGDNPYSIMEKVVVGENTRKDFHMLASPVFSGKTVTETGDGIKASITMIYLEDQEIQRKFQTDENGNFEIIVPKGMYSVVANAKAEVYGIDTDFIYQEDLNITFSINRNIVMEMTKVYRPSLSWDRTEERTVYPGTNITYHITVKNDGNCRDTYTFSGSPWDFQFTPSKITLSPGESATITVEISVPDDAKVNHPPVEIEAKSQGGESESVTVSVIVKPVYGASASIKNSYWENGNALYEIEVENTGNVHENFMITIENREELEAEGWSVGISTEKSGEYSVAIDSLGIDAGSSSTIYAKFIPLAKRPAYSPTLKIKIMSKDVEEHQSLTAPLPSVEISPEISVEGGNIQIWHEKPMDLGPIYWAIGIVVAFVLIHWFLRKKGVIM